MRILVSPPKMCSLFTLSLPPLLSLSRTHTHTQTQVVLKFPVNNNFALSTFETERAVNQRLDSIGSPRWAKYLGDIQMDPAVQPAGIGSVGMVFRKETGESLEDYLVERKDIGGKIGARSTGVVRAELAKKVMRELLLACQQMHAVRAC